MAELLRSRFVLRDIEGHRIDSFPCPRCGDSIPVDAGQLAESDGGEPVRRAHCPSCKEVLVRPANRGDSPWRLDE